MRLAPREEQVMRLTAEGLSARTIADLLHISEKTVETHRARGYHKLGLRRETLVRYAVGAGWLAVAPPLASPNT